MVWSRIAGQKPLGEAPARLVFQSGLAFSPKTQEEQAALTAALVRLAGEWALGMLRDLRQQAKLEVVHHEPFDALCDSTPEWLGLEIGALRFTKVR